MIDENIHILIFIAAGMIVGVVNYTGLWLTVWRLPRSGKPEILSTGSFYIRTLIVLAVLFFITDMQWEKIFFFFIGFLAIRTGFVFFFEVSSQKRSKTVLKGG